MEGTLTLEQLRRLDFFTDDCIRIRDDSHYWALFNSVSSPLEMFYLPAILNWGDRRTMQAIRRILQSPFCDAGTALNIYWLHVPDDWNRYARKPEIPDWARDDVELHLGIERNILESNYPSSVIRYDPRPDYSYWNEDGSETPDIADIPSHMKVPSPGTPPPEFSDLPWREI